MKHFVQSPASGQGVRVNLRILATTDLHMNILPYDYHTDRAVEGWGLSRTARLIDAARGEASNVILLDNGDCLFGSALGEGLSAVAGDQIHPMIYAMNHLRYDAMNLGNHDFDQGRAAMLDAIQGAAFPVLTANAKLPGNEGQTRIEPFTLLHRKVEDDQGRLHDLTLGVIGFLPPNSLHQAQIAATDILEAARRYVPQMKSQGADVIIVLAHSGLGAETHSPEMENVLLPLSEMEEIDALIGGHTHQIFPAIGAEVDSLLNGVPTVIPGFWGSPLGIIDLAIDRCDGQWVVCHSSACLRPVSDETSVTAPEGNCLEALFADLHNDTCEAMQAQVGEVAAPLDNYLTLVGADSATRLVQRAMLDHAHMCQEALGLPDLPILAASAAFKSGGFGGPDYYTSVPSGPLTQRSLADLYMFPNSFALVKVTGAFLRNWLERSCSIFNRVLPGRKAVQLKDDGVPGYIHESVLGLTYQVDLTQPSRFRPSGALRTAQTGRIRSLQHDGLPVKDDDHFLLATTDYRILGGGNYPIPDPADILPVAPIEIRDLLADYVANQGLIDIEATPIWQFLPVPDASVWFRSSPKGLEAASEYPWLRLSVLDPCDAHGFTRYELAL